MKIDERLIERVDELRKIEDELHVLAFEHGLASVGLYDQLQEAWAMIYEVMQRVSE